ncbi:CNTN1 [Mytilus coruscus]|uniref:CNTN1 n=1 Tax=Mytilus coruscus TaxID=42192 RepID=A0A6J8B5N5_MYTCO|nr:CNTN1 [Mytilus coruscus]
MHTYALKLSKTSEFSERISNSYPSYSTVTGPFLPSLTTKGEDVTSPYTDGYILNPELNKTKFMVVGSYNNNECNLKIMHFSREEDGIYRCTFEVMETVYINVYDVVVKNTPYINIAITPKKPNTIEGRNGIICCNVESYSPVMFTELMKNNEKLQIKSGIKNCLAFSPFHRNDSGHYTCFAKNSDGRSNSSIELKILYPPNVTVSYTLGTTYIDFTCDAAGEPNNYTFLSWKHESEYQEHIRFFNGTTHGTLRVKRTNNFVNQYKDSGYYICRVLNGIPDIKGKKIQEGKTYLPFADSNRKPQRYSASCWQIMGSLFGGSLFFSICWNIYCFLRRKKNSGIDTNIPLEVQYDEIGNVNFTSANIQVLRNNTQESVSSVDLPALEEINNTLSLEKSSSSDSSVQSQSISLLSGDGYEHPYQTVDPENIGMHPYSTVWSNLYQNTAVFPNQIMNKYAKERDPWVIIYKKNIRNIEVECDF